MIEAAPFPWFFRTLRGSSGEDHASSQEINAGATVALALDQLEPVDLPLGLATAAWVGQRMSSISCPRACVQPSSRSSSSSSGWGLRLDLLEQRALEGLFRSGGSAAH